MVLSFKTLALKIITLGAAYNEFNDYEDPGKNEHKFYGEENTVTDFNCFKKFGYKEYYFQRARFYKSNNRVLEFLLNGAELSLNSANSGNLINH